MGQGPSPPTALHRGDGGEPPIGIARPGFFNALINMLIIRPYIDADVDNFNSGTGSAQFVSISGHVSPLTDINRDRKLGQYRNIFSWGENILNPFKIIHNVIPPPRLILSASE